MKKIFLTLLLLSIVFCLSSCKIGEDGKREEVPDGAKEVASQFEEQNTRKDSSVIENLPEEQKEFLDTIGETTEGKKLVAYSDSQKFTLVYSCEFKDNVVSKVTQHYIIKDDSYFNVLKAGIHGSKVTVDEENKVIKADKTDEYKAKTYEEMLKAFSKYAVVE